MTSCRLKPQILEFPTPVDPKQMPHSFKALSQSWQYCRFLPLLKRHYWHYQLRIKQFNNATNDHNFELTKWPVTGTAFLLKSLREWPSVRLIAIINYYAFWMFQICQCFRRMPV